ncbi:GntR family transcriptional regulator [Brevibacillus choshinensis]|uniref:GntR family transcriptional regulator n=1 Tax=Brevibacillus choshinensis TaxID=54911 RepID=A0ABX7FRR8_BRECH|nr:GntR family transcriptional regulator [Brevibacillus choshinensis]QRG68867.1 GntR family transcriptional regulator [Brevibacillus choshinensis]
MAKYDTVRSDLAEKIEAYINQSGLSAHDKLPSERELSALWDVNRMTLRQAIERLVDEGILYSLHGSGTYVAPRKINRNLWQFLSFSDAMKESGLHTHTTVISFRKMEANKLLAKTFSILLGTEVVELVRIRHVENEPFALETIYLPSCLVPGLEQHDLEKQSLYAILREVYRIELTKSKQEISITYLTEEEASYLGVAPGDAAICTKVVTATEDKLPVEYTIEIARGDRCMFSTILK